MGFGSRAGGGGGFGEEGVDGGFELVEVYGFGKEFARAGDLRGVAGGMAGDGADHDDGDVPSGRMAGKDFAGAETVEVRQEEVEENEVGRAMPSGVEGVGGVEDGVEVVVGVGEAVLDEFGEVGFVVHDEDGFLHGNEIAGVTTGAMTVR